ncbi:hypothetical protein SprV_0502003500 [Sparganum proliferum]
MESNKTHHKPYVEDLGLIADPVPPAYRPCCDIYGRIIPVNKPYEKPIESERTKLGYDACTLPEVMRPRCPCCGFRQLPIECCFKGEVLPQACAYDPSDKRHRKIYSQYYEKFNDVCDERHKKNPPKC